MLPLFADRFTLHVGEALDVLRTLPDNSIDSLVTDPPSGIGFMGEQWDRDRGGFEFWIKWLGEILTECRRVLKPGGHGLIWSLPRTSHWTGAAIERSGLEVRDVVTHLFGSGMPKGRDIGDLIDRRREDEAEIRVLCRAIRAAMDTRDLKSSAVAPWFACDPRLVDHWAARDTDSQPALPTGEQWIELVRRFPELAEHNDHFEALAARKGKLGEAWHNREILEVVEAEGEHDRGFLRGRPKGYAVTAPEREEAQQWSGWSTCLKPAVEFWWLVRKSTGARSVVANVLEHGTGGINVDGCRITTENSEKRGRWPANLLLSHTEDCERVGSRDVKSSNARGRRASSGYSGGQGEKDREVTGYAENGRETVADWKCARGCPVAELDEQTGHLHASGNKADVGTGRDRQYDASSYHVSFAGRAHRDFGDSGSAARFFYVSKAAPAERLAYCEECDRIESARGSQARHKGHTDRVTVHPTQKGAELMRWLVRLVTPPGGVVLDPFTGSGTTGVAAVTEGFEFVGIERDPSFARIARYRLRTGK